MTLSTRLWKLPKSTSKKQNIYNILLITWRNRVKLNRDIQFTCILRLLNNTCVKHNFKSVHVSNLFWSREYNSAKEICKYPSFSPKVGSNYPLDLKIIWSSVVVCTLVWIIRGFFLINRGNTHHSDTYAHYILASRWLTIYILCYFHKLVWMKKPSVLVCTF